MDHLEKILIGVVLFVVTSVVAYLFRMRQLYVAAPKLYRHAPISDAGSICELIVFNNGNQAEESIQVDLDPDLKIELLASSSSDIKMDGSTLKIERLHKGCEASAMLLVEAGVLDAAKILSVSSKATKGTVYKKLTEVPPNYAMMFLISVLMIGIIPATIYGLRAYESINAKYIENRLSALHKVGWSNLSKYYSSDIRLSYSSQEFPVRFSGRQIDKSKKPFLQFDIINKTALPMKVYVDLQGRPKLLSPYFSSAETAPMSSTTLLIKEPEPSADSPNPKLDFSIQVGDEYLYGLIYEPVRE